MDEINKIIKSLYIKDKTQSYKIIPNEVPMFLCNEVPLPNSNILVILRCDIEIDKKTGSVIREERDKITSGIFNETYTSENKEWLWIPDFIVAWTYTSYLKNMRKVCTAKYCNNDVQLITDLNSDVLDEFYLGFCSSCQLTIDNYIRIKMVEFDASTELQSKCPPFSTNASLKIRWKREAIIMLLGYKHILNDDHTIPFVAD